MTMRTLAVSALIVSALGLTACGGEDSDKDSAATQSTPTPVATSGDLTDLSKKPDVKAPEGDAPEKLEIEDVVTGKGRAAKSGDSVKVHYVGVAYSNGQQFDASWDRGTPFDFVLDKGMVIKGWDQGVLGMKVGGRRRLTIPPDLAYGPEGQPGAIAPNETLIFVVDLVSIA